MYSNNLQYNNFTLMHHFKFCFVFFIRYVNFKNEIFKYQNMAFRSILQEMQNSKFSKASLFIAM